MTPPPQAGCLIIIACVLAAPFLLVDGGRDEVDDAVTAFSERLAEIDFLVASVGNATAGRQLGDVVAASTPALFCQNDHYISLVKARRRAETDAPRRSPLQRRLLSSLQTFLGAAKLAVGTRNSNFQ